MRVYVELFAQLRDAAGTGTLQIDVGAGATLEDALRHIVATAPQELADLLFKGSELSPSIMVAIDGVQTHWGEGIPLHEGAAIVLASPIAGG